MAPVAERGAGAFGDIACVPDRLTQVAALDAALAHLSRLGPPVPDPAWGMGRGGTTLAPPCARASTGGQTNPAAGVYV